MTKPAPATRKYPGNLIVLILLFIASLWLVLGIADMVFDDDNLRIDHRVISFMERHVSAAATSFFHVITFFGSAEFLFPAYTVLVILFWRKPSLKPYAWKVAFTGIVGTGIMFLLKELLRRPRPSAPLLEQAQGYSFPSGHSFSSMVFYGMLAYFIYHSNGQKPLKAAGMALMITMIILVGVSRLYLRVHYATDVMAGWSLGLMWLLIVYYFFVYRKNTASAKTTRH